MGAPPRQVTHATRGAGDALLAVRTEVARLAVDVDPGRPDRLRRQWRRKHLRRQRRLPGRKRWAGVIGGARRWERP
jgi:hypothetical protein